MEVLDKVDPMRGFLCHKCDYTLVRNTDNSQGGHEQSTRLNSQFRFITDLLPKIDQVVIPNNTFEVALAAARPVIRDNLNPANETAPIDSNTHKPAAVKGLTNTGPTSIAVTVTTSEGSSTAERAAEQMRKETLKIQNQLPAHFTHSTVTGEAILPTSTPSFTTSPTFDEHKDKKDITSSFAGNGAEIDDYFAQLKAEQAREAINAEEFESDEEEDDEGDLGFEDVVPAREDGTGFGSIIGTPMSSASVNGAERDPKIPPIGLTSSLKRANTGTGSSNGGTSTGNTSPVTGPHTPESGRAAKRVRIEDPGRPAKEDEESEEDVEFEDV